MIKMRKLFVVIFLFANFITSAQIFSNVDLEAGVNFVADLICSEEFIQIRKANSDLDAIDSLFSKTKAFYNDDISEALLALTLGTLPYSEMPLVIPLFNSNMNVPLPTKRNNMDLKIKNLPSHFMIDSPKNHFGDKDKLAHFFGNAYLEYSIPIFNVSDFMSIFVEKFEESFKVEGALDKRDLQVNKLGKEFGRLLLNDTSTLPSVVLTNKSLD